MNSKQFTSRDMDLSIAVDLLENLVNSIGGDPETHLYDQEQAHAFLEAYYLLQPNIIKWEE